MRIPLPAARLGAGLMLTTEATVQELPEKGKPPAMPPGHEDY